MQDNKQVKPTKQQETTDGTDDITDDSEVHVVQPKVTRVDLSSLPRFEQNVSRLRENFESGNYLDLVLAAGDDVKLVHYLVREGKVVQDVAGVFRWV